MSAAPFLRGARVALHATMHPAPAGPDAWLDPGAAMPGHDEILMEARPAGGGAPFALVGLCAIDWVHRDARLCAGPAPGAAPPDDDALAEALGLVVRYAAEELALERIEADPGAAPAGVRETLARALGAAGLGQPAPGGAFILRLPDPLPPP